MSQTNGTGDVHIQDEEGIVDRKVKEHILSLRRQLDEDERQLFIEDYKNPNINMTFAEATQFWGITVKQYLRSIKRIWDEENPGSSIPNVQHFWNDKKIGEVELVPPDKSGYQFSLVAREGVDKDRLKKRLGLPRDAELPEPVTKPFYGLESMLEQDVVQQTWTVYTSKRGAPPNWDEVILQEAQPIPKGILEEAVEVADNFLQQAGIGFDIAADDYTADSGPGL